MATGEAANESVKQSEMKSNGNMAERLID